MLQSDKAINLFFLILLHIENGRVLYSIYSSFPCAYAYNSVNCADKNLAITDTPCMGRRHDSVDN